jgi:two-component system, chemotaxis family, chemotaxis protein CheY
MAPAKPEILVVEDELELRALLSRCLRANGYVVKSSGNGAEALAELARTDSVRLIVLDLNMPILDGFQFLAYREQEPRLRDVPVIVLSSEADAGPLPFAGYVRLHKPVDIATLLDSVQRSYGSPRRCSADDNATAAPVAGPNERPSGVRFRSDLDPAAQRMTEDRPARRGRP